MGFFQTLATLAINVQVNTTRVNGQLNALQQRLQGLGTPQGNLANRIDLTRSLAQLYLLRSAITAAFQGMSMVVEKAAEIEQGFIAIERVAKELKGTSFRDDLMALANSLPGVSLQELQKALKVTAQLGIHSKDDLLAFGKIVVELATITGTSGEDIATHLGKIATIFKIDPKNIEPFVNAVLQLADDMPVTEQEILDITEKLGGFAHTIGLSARETAAFAATMKSVGPSSSEARTALFSLFSKLEAHPGKIADAFGITKEQMNHIFELMRSNPSEGIIAFLKLLQGKSPGAMIQALEKMGIKGRNNASSIIALATNLNILKKALNDAKKGAEENTRLHDQMADNAAGLTAKLVDLKKAWDEFLFSLGNSEGIKNTIGTLTDLINKLTELNNAMTPNDPHFDWWNHPFTSAKNAIQQWINPTAALDNPSGELGLHKGGKTPDPNQKKITPGNVNKDFNNLFDADKKGKRKAKDTDHFKGFMNLEDAWKNKVLDSLDDEKKKFEKLEDIWKENQKQNENLQAINTTLKTTAFKAVVV